MAMKIITTKLVELNKKPHQQYYLILKSGQDHLLQGHREEYHEELLEYLDEIEIKYEDNIDLNEMDFLKWTKRLEIQVLYSSLCVCINTRT